MNKVRAGTGSRFESRARTPHDRPVDRLTAAVAVTVNELSLQRCPGPTSDAYSLELQILEGAGYGNVMRPCDLPIRIGAR